MSEQSLAKGFAILSFSGIVVKLMSLIYIPLLKNILGGEGYGIYQVAYQVFVWVYVVGNSGIPIAISKQISEFISAENFKDAIRVFKISRTILVVVGIITSILMFTTAGFTASLLKHPEAALPIAFLAPSLFFTCINSAYRGYYQGRGNMIPTSVSQIIEQVINVIFTLLFAYLFIVKKDVIWACAGGTIGTTLGALFCTFYLIHYHSKHRKIKLPRGYIAPPYKRKTFSFLAKLIIAAGIPATLSIMLQYSGNLIDIAIIQDRLTFVGFDQSVATSLFADLTIYIQLLSAPIAITAALTSAVIPAIAAAVVKKDRIKVQSRSDFAMRMCFFVTIPSAAGLSILSYSIYWMMHLGDSDYLMMYGSFCLIFLAILQIQTSILQGAGRLYTATFNIVLGIITRVVVDYFVIPLPGIDIKGAIIGSFASYLVPIALNTMVMRRQMNVQTSFVALASKPLLASIVMSIFAYLCHQGTTAILYPSRLDPYWINTIATLFSIFFGGLVYLLMLVVLKAIKREDLDILPSRFSKIISPLIIKSNEN